MNTATYLTSKEQYKPFKSAGLQLAQEREISLKFAKREKLVFQKGFATVISKKNGEPFVIDLDKLQFDLSQKIMQGQWRMAAKQTPTVTPITSPTRAARRRHDEESEEEGEPVAVEVNVQGTLLGKIMAVKWVRFELEEFKAFSKTGVSVKLVDILQVIDDSLQALKRQGHDDANSKVNLLL